MFNRTIRSSDEEIDEESMHTAHESYTQESLIVACINDHISSKGLRTLVPNVIDYGSSQEFFETYFAVIKSSSKNISVQIKQEKT
jgi:hypothetical protein